MFFRSPGARGVDIAGGAVADGDDFFLGASEGFQCLEFRFPRWFSYEKTTHANATGSKTKAHAAKESTDGGEGGIRTLVRLP